MKTEKLKQNVKGYVHQFEDGGLRLLRKGQKRSEEHTSELQSR